jgi:hypothetical protein
MRGWLVAILLPCGLLLAARFVWACGRSKAEDPKLRMLESLLRLGDEEAYPHKH